MKNYVLKQKKSLSPNGFFPFKSLIKVIFSEYIFNMLQTLLNTKLIIVSIGKQRKQSLMESTPHLDFNPTELCLICLIFAFKLECFYMVKKCINYNMTHQNKKKYALVKKKQVW